MTAPPTTPPRLQIAGRFVLDTAERRLLDDRLPVALGGRALDLLIALAQRPDHLFTKAELLDKVWPGLVVEEANLQVQVTNLRRALGADAIATVPGRGYRLVATVVPESAQPATADAGGDRAGAASAGPAAIAPGAVTSSAPALIGRAADLDRLVQQLQPGRCVTLLGPAGVGKTSLARQLMARPVKGATRWTWVDLGGTSLDAQLPGAVARALGLTLAEGDALPQVMAELCRPVVPDPAGRGSMHLLVLDNAEHLATACAALVAALVAAAAAPTPPMPGLLLLVTSQVPLQVDGEQLLRLEPLPVPAAGVAANAPGDGALALLLQRLAAAGRSSAPSPATLGLLRDICVRLDGLPLALEMAAPRIALLGAQAVRDALDERFALLTNGRRDAAARHRTLEAALDWSYQLLSPGAQQLFRGLGVFVGGFTLELLEALLADASPPLARWALIDALAELADHSLLVVGPEDTPRYRMLESMRAFGQQRCAGGEAAAWRRRHARALADLFERYDPLAPDEAEVRTRCLAEMENAQAALDWARMHEPPWAVRIAARAARASTFSLWRSECTRWLHDLRPLLESEAGRLLPQPVQARWWTEYARTAAFLDQADATAAGRHAVALWQGQGHPQEALFAAVVWVRSHSRPGPELDAACAALAEAQRAVPSPSIRERQWIQGAWNRAALAREDMAALFEGRLAELQLAREVGVSDIIHAAETNVVTSLNEADRHAEAAELAADLLRRIDLGRGDDDANLPWALNGWIEALLGLGRLDQAQALLPRALAAGRRGNTQGALPLLALLAARQGRLEAAAELVGLLQHWATRQGGKPRSISHDALNKALALATAGLTPARLQACLEQGRHLDDAGVDARAAEGGSPRSGATPGSARP